VYLELTGGRQAGLGLVAVADTGLATGQRDGEKSAPRPARPHAPSAAENAAHAALVARLKNPIWTI